MPKRASLLSFRVAPRTYNLPTRRLALLEQMSAVWDIPAEAVLGLVDAEGNAIHQKWEDPVTENPSVGDTEVWEIYNCTADAHPMHVHEVNFEVVNRQPITFDEGEEDGQITNIQVTGAARPAEPWEDGFKDTVIAYPNEVTRIKARFNNSGQFVWQCHIVEHEDNEMMRPFRVGPEQPGQPGLH